MELVVGIGLALGGSGAAGAAAGVGITSGIAGGFSASTALTAISGLSTAFGVVSAIGEGRAREAELRAQAAEADFLATDEFIQGQEEQAALKREFALTLQRQRVALASGGVDLASPSAVELERQVTEDAERELGISRNQALRSELARRRTGRNLRTQARGAVGRAVLGQLPQIANFTMGVANRG